MKTVDASKQTCRVASAAAEFMGKQGHFLAPGISAQPAGAQGINLQIAIIPLGDGPRHISTSSMKLPFASSAANQGCGTAKDSNNISSLKLATFFTSQPICPICPTI